MRSKTKILHVIDGFGAGGAETWLLACVKYLSEHPELNLQFDFLASGGKKRLYDDEITSSGSSIYYIKYSMGSILNFRKHFIKILKENSYTAIHHHADFISGWHFLAGIGSLPKVRISHVHNPYNFVNNYVVNVSRWFSFKVGRVLTLLLTSKITGTSNWVMDEYGYDKWPFNLKRTTPAYCGFEVSKFMFNENARIKMRNEFGWQEEDKVILFAGRIGLHSYDSAPNQKNPVFAFNIAKKIASSNKSFRIVFVGVKGPLGETMEKQVTSENLTHQIKFLGLRHDLNLIMSACDSLLFPSFWEGLGMVVVEAQASGLPVLMSDSIPMEGVIVQELVHRLDLRVGEDEWVEKLIKIKEPKDRKKYNFEIDQSVFAIQRSVLSLMSLYNIKI